MRDFYIGIDNGVTGTIAIVDGKGCGEMFKTPVIKQQDYTKKIQNVSRLDVHAVLKILRSCIEAEETKSSNIKVIIERPFTNNNRIYAKAEHSAMRCFEAFLIIFDMLCLPYQIIDSRDWQKIMLGGRKGDDTKKLSMDKGLQLFPTQKEIIMRHKDADSLLMAEWARRVNL